MVHMLTSDSEFEDLGFMSNDICSKTLITSLRDVCRSYCHTM